MRTFKRILAAQLCFMSLFNSSRWSRASETDYELDYEPETPFDSDSQDNSQQDNLPYVLFSLVAVGMVCIVLAAPKCGNSRSPSRSEQESLQELTNPRTQNAKDFCENFVVGKTYTLWSYPKEAFVNIVKFLDKGSIDNSDLENTPSSHLFAMGTVLLRFKTEYPNYFAPDSMFENILQCVQTKLLRKFQRDMPGYNFKKCLGVGSAGQVWQACDQSGTEVAIKVASKGVKRSNNEAQNDILIVEQMKKKDLCNKGSVLTHLVTYQNYIEKSEMHYFVMDYIKNAETVKTRKPNSNDEAHKWQKQLFEALNHLHQAGIVHNDVWVTNMLIDENGDLYLCDFGLSEVTDNIENCKYPSRPTSYTLEWRRSSWGYNGQKNDVYAALRCIEYFSGNKMDVITRLESTCKNSGNVSAKDALNALK